MVQYTEWRSISDGSIISSIPDSELSQLQNRYPISEGTGQTFEDIAGSENATANFSNWESGDWVGGYISRFNGEDDEADSGATLPGGEFGIAVTIDINESKEGVDETVISFGSSSGSSDTGRFIQFNDGDGLRFWGRDDDTSTAIVTDGTTAAGTYRVVAFNDPDNNEIGIAVNGSTPTRASNGSGMSADAGSHGIGYRVGSDRNFGGGISDIQLVASTPTNQQISDDYDSMPWS